VRRPTSRSIGGTGHNPSVDAATREMLRRAVDEARRAELHRTGKDAACNKHDDPEPGCLGCYQRKRSAAHPQAARVT
jgi:hypothetical protein